MAGVPSFHPLQRASGKISSSPGAMAAPAGSNSLLVLLRELDVEDQLPQSRQVVPLASHLRLVRRRRRSRDRILLLTIITFFFGSPVLAQVFLPLLLVFLLGFLF